MSAENDKIVDILMDIKKDTGASNAQIIDMKSFLVDVNKKIDDHIKDDGAHGIKQNRNFVGALLSWGAFAVSMVMLIVEIHKR